MCLTHLPYLGLRSIEPEEEATTLYYGKSVDITVFVMFPQLCIFIDAVCLCTLAIFRFKVLSFKVLRIKVSHRLLQAHCWLGQLFTDLSNCSYL